MIASDQNAVAAAAEARVLAVLTDVAFVVPAALAFDAPRPAHLNHCGGVLLTRQQFGPGLTTQLELGDQQPVTEPIHLSIPKFQPQL